VAELGLIIKVGLDQASLKKANAKIGDFLKTGLKAGAVGAAGALATVGVAAGVAAAETIAFADEANAAMEQFRRETGLAEGNVKQFSNSAKNLFAAGFGEIDDIAATMARITNTMQTGASETEKLTKRALTMRDVFDKDVGESIDAVKVLMDEFGLTSEEAFDFLVTGAQKGLDRNDDLLDTVREYGNLFGDTGLSAAEFFSILETGAEGGVLGTDKIADAFKELNIRLSDASSDQADAFETVTGNSFERVAGFIRGGDEAWGEYFKDIIAGLQKIEDPLERNRLQVELFGTQAEDLGVSFSEDIDLASTSLDDMSGSMDEIVDKNMTLGESMGNLKRQMVVALEPAAQELMPLLAEGVSKASEFLTEARPIFQGFASELSEKLGPTLQIVGDSLRRIGVVLGIVSGDADGMDASLQVLEKTLNFIVTAIEGVAVASKLIADAFEIAKGLADQLGQISETRVGRNVGVILGSFPKAVGSVLGFQEGGGFTVGGSGGPDSQLVSFNATPGERVDVSTPGQASGGIIININAPVFGVDDLDTKLNAWGQMIIDSVSEAMA
jgi:hypothetical protein